MRTVPRALAARGCAFAYVARREFFSESIALIIGRDIALFSARMADDKKAEDIVVYDLRGLTDVTDYLVLATAHSRSQVRAIVESIKRELKLFDVRKVGQEGNEGGSWVLIDYADCVVHVFSPELREYYSLESLWGDAPQLDWKRDKIKHVQLRKRLVKARAEAEAGA
jgi:ribosome-associated protein